LTKLPMIFRGHKGPGFFASAVSAADGYDPFSILPGNQPSAGARYVCIVALLDFPRMAQIETRKRAIWHYSDLEPVILDDIRAGRAVLLFDLSNEGPRYHPSIFGELRAWIETNHLPAGRCIWLAQNRAIAQAARADAGSGPDLIAFENYDYYIKTTAKAFAGRKVLDDQAKAESRQFNLNRKDRLLLCLNATPRVQRVLAVAALLHHQLISRSLVSFSGMSYVKNGCSIADVMRFVEGYPRLRYLLPAVSTVGEMSALKADSFEETGNDLVYKVDQAQYERTFLSLVTETDFSDGKSDRVTEKLTKTFCMGHPALVLGNPNAVRFMTDLGFQDWNDVLDRSPEAISSPGDRFEAVIGEMLRQVSRIERDPQGWLDNVREVGMFNFRHAVHGGLQAHCVKSMDQPILNRLSFLIGIH
jgi:hypothetical protein